MHQCEARAVWGGAHLCRACMNIHMYVYTCMYIIIYMHQYEAQAVWGGGHLCSAPTCAAPIVELRMYECTYVCVHMCVNTYMCISMRRRRYVEGNTCVQRQPVTRLELNCGCMNIHVYVNSVYICISSIRVYVDISV